MRVHYCGSNLQSQLFKVSASNNKDFSRADLQGADSSLSQRYDEARRITIVKNLSPAITRVLVALIVNTILLGMVIDLTGVGTGPGTLYSVFVLTLMVIIGTVAWATISPLGCTFLQEGLLDEPNLLLNGVNLKWEIYRSY